MQLPGGSARQGALRNEVAGAMMLCLQTVAQTVWCRLWPYLDSKAIRLLACQTTLQHWAAGQMVFQQICDEERSLCLAR